MVNRHTPARIGKGGRGKCRVCSSGKQAEIDEALVRGVSYRDLGARYGISPSSIVRHRRQHLSPALVAVKERRLARGAKSIVDRLEALIARMEAIHEAAFAAKNAKLALAAIRELRSTLELVARITGELDQRPAVTVNLQTTPEWVRIREVVMEFVQPERRPEMARRLKLLEEDRRDVN